MNKLKILNDPVYGFISIPDEFIFDLIEHPWFQRLRRIRQLGLTSLVYPGALHTRFHHALGAMHLTGLCLGVLSRKGSRIPAEEQDAVLIAALLHDIGHGPFSHALEGWIIPGAHHESISALLFDRLNHHFDGKLSLAMEVFKPDFNKRFLHQMVSSQLDMDRLDYLKRDSFFTGVSEGVINADRIITMMRVVDNQLVVDSKGIYSLEKFVVARRLMYWQVYLHKTVVAAEQLLVNIMRRARHLAQQGARLFSTSSLAPFLAGDVSFESFKESEQLTHCFTRLDDDDISVCIKEWMYQSDKVLSILCKRLNGRHLPHCTLSVEPPDEDFLDRLTGQAASYFSLSREDASWLISTGEIENAAYASGAEAIMLHYPGRGLVDLSHAADQLNISALSEPLRKYFCSYPKEIL